MSPPSSSESSIVSLTTLSVPMPMPGTPSAPLFKGKHVEDFLDSLEQHADSMRIDHNHLPPYILRYCHTKVCKVISGSALLSGSGKFPRSVTTMVFEAWRNAPYHVMKRG